MNEAARILLTGATGFVGSHVLERLLAAGHTVVATQNARRESFDTTRLSWEPLDLLQATPAEVKRIVTRHRLTHCLHAAWYTNHADYLVAEINRAWLDASKLLANAFFDAGGRRFVALGTCVEYAPISGLCGETETPLAPETLYGQCKVELYRHLQAAPDAAWARLFFIYGPGDRGGRLVPFILDKLARGEVAIPRFGGLRRDYVHADDLAAQLESILSSNLQGAVNTGSGDPVAISEIFITCGALFGRPDLVDTNDLVAPGEPRVIGADLTKYRNTLGEPPARTLQAGLAPLIAEARGK